MTRVSDALARAAALDSKADFPQEQHAGVSPTEVQIHSWPTEEPGDVDQLSPDVLVQRDRGTNAEAETGPLGMLEGRALSEKLVTAERPHGAIEQYRRLAARLHLAQAQSETRTVMVTSAVIGEGKTLTATNLALTLSESYKRRVLLIDADLRRPWVHELLKLPNLSGLNDGIRSGVDRKVPLISVSQYLSVLTAGRPDPDPMSVLSSDRMRRVLADAARAFDWVIVDTPPVGMLSDAHLLSSLVDTVVLVIKAGTTPLRAMKQSVEAIGRDRILGVVLNCTDAASHVYQYYGYGHRVENTATVQYRG